VISGRGDNLRPKNGGSEFCTYLSLINFSRPFMGQRGSGAFKSFYEFPQKIIEKIKI
jgi:hypothetical protein